MRNLPISFLLISILFFVSCKSSQPYIERFYSDTTIIREIPRIVEIPGQTIQSNPINIDSLVSLLRAGVPPSVIEKITIREDANGNKVGILIDELGNLTALCQTQDQIINLLDTEITRLRQEIINTTIIDKPNFFQRIKASIDLLVYTTLIILAGLFILKRFLP